MTITAIVIADSIADRCPRITTVQLRYPRFIHSEFMAHRAFSRNASSSRAIPVERLIQDVENDPARPMFWGANQSGMQADDELPEPQKQAAKCAWEVCRDQALINARKLADTGLHKQIVNRILEPFAHINVLVTATDWDNFFALRDHPDAQPEIAALARAMREAMAGSDPEWLSEHDWHAPYAMDMAVDHMHQLEISAASCASVSYKTVDGKPMTVDKALAIYDKLAGSDPIHASPFEHIARPDPSNGAGCRNFDRWHQWRHDVEGGK